MTYSLLAMSVSIPYVLSPCWSFHASRKAHALACIWPDMHPTTPPSQASFSTSCVDTAIPHPSKIKKASTAQNYKNLAMCGFGNSFPRCYGCATGPSTTQRRSRNRKIAKILRPLRGAKNFFLLTKKNKSNGRVPASSDLRISGARRPFFSYFFAHRGVTSLSLCRSLRFLSSAHHRASFFYFCFFAFFVFLVVFLLCRFLVVFFFFCSRLWPVALIQICARQARRVFKDE